MVRVAGAGLRGGGIAGMGCSCGNWAQKELVRVRSARAHRNPAGVGLGDAAQVPPQRSYGVRGGGAPVHDVPVTRLVYRLPYLA